MAERKINLLELKAQYGIDEDDLEDLQKKSIVLTFEEDDGFNKDGEKKIRSTYKGKPVFRHSGFAEDNIRVGDTWICTLVDKTTYYFAKAVKKVDASFLLDLTSGQIDDIAQCLWNSQRHILEPAMENKYKEELAKTLDTNFADERRKYDEMIDEQKDMIQRLQRKEAENLAIINSLSQKPTAAATDATSVQDSGPTQSIPQEISVNRDGPDKISSAYFTSHKYFVHLCPDTKIIILRPNDKLGNAVCIDNAITLKGLSSNSPYNGPRPMVATYNQKYGGIQVHLD